MEPCVHCGAELSIFGGVMRHLPSCPFYQAEPIVVVEDGADDVETRTCELDGGQLRRAVEADEREEE